MSRRAARFALPLLVLCAGCLFSTTPPKPNPSDDGTVPDPTRARITGSVLLFDQVDHTYRRAPGRTVKLRWLGNLDPQDGVLDLLETHVVNADRSGTFEDACGARRVAAVEVHSYICEFDPAQDDQFCCLEVPPCACPNIWTTPRRVSVALGVRVQQNVVVPCH